MKSNSKKYTAKASIENRVAKPAPKEKNTHLKKQEPKGKFYDVIFKNPIPYIIIFIFTFLIYSQTFKFDIVSLDDDILIKDNYHLISNINNIFQTFKTDSYFHSIGRYYRPLLNISIMIDTQLSSSYFNIYHVSNTLFHCLVSCLIFYLFLLFNFDKIISLLSSLIFASHPLMVNSVAWINARNDLLLALFFLLSIIFLIKYFDNNRIIYLIFHFCSFCLSLLSKETAMVFPLIYIVYILLFQRKRLLSLKDLLLIFLWTFPIILFLILRSFVVTGNDGVQNPFNNITNNILYNFAVFPDVYKKIFLPIDLSPIPFYNNTNIIIGTVLLLSTFIIIIFQFSRQKQYYNNKSKFQLFSFYSLYGIILFFIIMFPGTVTKVGGGNSFDYLENRAYLPMIGVLISLTSFYQYYFADKFKKSILLITGIIIISLLSILTINLSKIYSDPISFYNYATIISPKSAWAWNKKGEILDKSLHHGEAIKCFDNALAIRQDNNYAWKNKGLALLSLNRYESAIKCFDNALAINQNHADVWCSKGIALCYLGKFEDAVKCFDRAIVIQSDYSTAWNKKGTALGSMGNHHEAIECYDKAVAIQPDYSDAWYNRGISHSNLGKFESAIKCYDKAVALKPDFLDAWNNKALALYYLKKYDEAIQSISKAIEIKPKFALLWQNKGIMLREAGRIKESEECIRRAEELSKIGLK